MPNWCEEDVCLEGLEDDVDQAVLSMRGEDGSIIDFNQIIPMPKDLMITSGTVQVQALAIHKYKLTGEVGKLTQYLGFEWVKSEGIDTIEKLIPFLIKRSSKHLEDGLTFEEIGARAYHNIQKYGHKDWYTWSTVNWGTKWNAVVESELEATNLMGGKRRVKFTMRTAWAPPHPIFEALSAKNPRVRIKVKYYEMGSGFAGTSIYLDGKCIEHKEKNYHGDRGG
jgi:hypothetical protein